MDAGGEMDYQIIPKKVVDGSIRKKRIVIRVFTKTHYLPAMRQVLIRHRLYLQEPVDLSVNCRYFNFQLLCSILPPKVVQSTYFGNGAQEHCKLIRLPEEVVLKMA